MHAQQSGEITLTNVQAAAVNAPAVPTTPAGQVNAPQGQLAGRQVTPGTGDRIKSALTGAAHAVRDFFSGLPTRYDNWQAGRAIAHSHRSADRAATELVDNLRQGMVSAENLGLLQTLAKHSGRVDPQNPDALAQRLVGLKLSALPPKERVAVLCADLSAIASSAKALAGQQIDDLANMLDSLGEAGLVGQGDADKTRNNAGGVHKRIDDAVVLLRDRFGAERVNDFKAIGHGLIQVDSNGHVTGTSVNAPPPKVDGFTPTAQSTAAMLIEAKGNDRLQSLTGDQAAAVHSVATADWPRMNIIWDDGHGGQYNTKTNDAADSVAKMRAFTGSDEATKVLSCILHQHEVRTIVRAITAPDGTVVTFQPPPKGYDAQVTDSSGHVQRIKNPGQIGDARITISKTAAGDFEVNVDWDYLSTSVVVTQDNASQIVDPGNPTHASVDSAEQQTVNCLKIKLAGQFTVSGDHARQGRLGILPGSTFTHTFSGALAMPQ